MAANKTRETDADVAAFVAGVPDPTQRADAGTLIAMLSRVSGHPPRMWGPSIIGFGSYRYRTDAGREGEMCRIGFSPRKAQTVIYGMGVNDRPALLARLGKHKIGKGCLYLKRLADIDIAVLEAMATAAWTAMSAAYPE